MAEINRKHNSQKKINSPLSLLTLPRTIPSAVTACPNKSCSSVGEYVTFPGPYLPANDTKKRKTIVTQRERKKC